MFQQQEYYVGPLTLQSAALKSSVSAGEYVRFA
jgi:hypothetical protein